jgi:DNA-binding protein HU-beta
MTKTDLIAKIAQDAGLTKTVAAKALSSMIDGVGEALKKGDSLAIPGFGTFSVSKRAARTGRNPQTGEAIQISAKNVVKFKAGKGLKEIV